MASKPPTCTHPKFPHLYFANPFTKRKGVTIAIRDTVLFKLRTLEVDPNGQFLILSVTFHNQVITLVNIYSPKTHQNFFFKSFCQMTHKLQPYRAGSIIICGDYNDIKDPSIDSTSSTHKSSSSLSTFFDAWRCIHCNERDYVFYSNMRKVYSRIYFFLVDKLTLQHITSSQIGLITWSDHAPISIALLL